jgi:pimeloyl-ACP methyl ester carboxylesterase
VLFSYFAVINVMLSLVLLPALLCDAELYRTQAVALADLADPLSLPASGSTLAESAQAVLRQAPPRFALAGTSAGGSLALEIVASAPARVAGLWLMGANPGASADPDGARRLNERVRAGEFAAVVDDLAARAIYANGPRAAGATETFRRMAHRAGPEVFLRDNAALIAREDRWSALGLLAVPTLVLWGRHDQFATVERAREIAARVPSARLVVLEDCGHLPTLEQPDACVRAARDWLGQCRAG